MALNASLLAIAILRRLGRRPATGHDLQRELGADDSSFAAASGELWNSVFLRGHTSDGCCNDPCGPACVSAFKRERIWMLTEHGEIALQALPDDTSTHAID